MAKPDMQSPDTPLSLAAVNALDRAAFTRRIGPVFEHSPWIAEATWDRRPFASRETLLQALGETVAGAGEERQVALIQAHPDLVGRAALAGTLTAASTREQSSAGLDRLTPEEIQSFQDYNAAYRARFGFPFVICARLNKKAAILAAFPNRLAQDRAAEIRTALLEIAKIARLRLEELVSP